MYSSFFTENGSNYTVTAKQTAGFNKLKYTIIYTMHDIKISNISLQTHTFSIGLKLFTIWHTIFWWFWYCFWNCSTCFFRRVLGISKQKKNIWHSLTMSILLVWNNFIKNLLTTKSNESKSVFLIEQASGPYNRIGTHLVSSRCIRQPLQWQFSLFFQIIALATR